MIHWLTGEPWSRYTSQRPERFPILYTPRVRPADGSGVKFESVSTTSPTLSPATIQFPVARRDRLLISVLPATKISLSDSLCKRYGTPAGGFLSQTGTSEVNGA